MKKCLVVFLSLLLAWSIGVILSSCSGSADDVYTIGLTQIAEHPSLNAVANGVRAGLKDLGYEEGQNLKIIFRNANRDPSLTLPIAESFVKQEVDVIVPISTPSALSAAKATDRIPIVFVGVSDPVGVGLVKNMDHPGGNVTGSSDQWPFEKQIDLFKEIMPGLGKLGLMYSPGDDVSLIAVDKLQAMQEEKGFELVAVPITSPSDVYSTARQMLLDVDAIYTGTDNLIVENLSTVLKAANEAKKPVFAGDEGSVEKGALATFSISMFDLGYDSADLIDRVLKGENAGDIPVLIASSGEVIVNKQALGQLKITLPDELEVGKYIE